MNKTERAAALRRHGWKGRSEHWTHAKLPGLVASLRAAERQQAMAEERRHLTAERNELTAELRG